MKFWLFIDKIIQELFYIAIIVCVIGLMLLVLSVITGCTKTEIEYRDKIVEVYKPVPTKCDLNITASPIIKYETLQQRTSSITELVFDGVEIREIIKTIPCLNINYKPRDMK